MRQSWDEYFLDLAKTASQRSTCPRLSVGCVIVDKDHNVVSTGYNGSRPGDPHCIDVGCDDSSGRCLRTIHAEINAIQRSSKSKRHGSTLYCTHLPCRDCARGITTSGISEVVYSDSYRIDPETVDLFNYHCIVYRQIA